MTHRRNSSDDNDCEDGGSAAITVRISYPMDGDDMNRTTGHKGGREALAVLRAAERVRLRMQMERGDDTTSTGEFVLWLWQDRWMTRQKWTALPPRDRDAYVSAYLHERAARRMIERAYEDRPVYRPGWRAVTVAMAVWLALLAALWQRSRG
jgi:hypothetical protein